MDPSMDAQWRWVMGFEERVEQLTKFAHLPLNTPQRLYFTGGTLALLGLFWAAFFFVPFWIVVTLSGICTMCFALVQEIWAFAKALLASSLAYKLLSAMTAIAILPFYQAWVGQIVNQISGLPPSFLPNSTALMGTLLLPPAILFVSALCLMVYSLGQMFVQMLRSIQVHINSTIHILFTANPPNVDKRGVFLTLARIIAAMILSLALFHTLTLYNRLGSGLQVFYTEMVLFADYYPHSYCRNVKVQERVAFLKDGQISVAAPAAGQWRFRLAKCEAVQ